MGLFTKWELINYVLFIFRIHSHFPPDLCLLLPNMVFILDLLLADKVWNVYNALFPLSNSDSDVAIPIAKSDST